MEDFKLKLESAASHEVRLELVWLWAKQEFINMAEFKELMQFIEEQKTKPDLSFMWHCSDEPDNLMDYSCIIPDKNVAKALNKAAVVGFRNCLRKIEDLHIIQMGDIDRSLTEADQVKWDESFKTEK